MKVRVYYSSPGVFMILHAGQDCQFRELLGWISSPINVTVAPFVVPRYFFCYVVPPHVGHLSWYININVINHHVINVLYQDGLYLYVLYQESYHHLLVHRFALCLMGDILE